jgi:hypothetical protein
MALTAASDMTCAICASKPLKCHEFPSEAAAAGDPEQAEKTMKPSLLKECSIKTKKPVFS